MTRNGRLVLWLVLGTVGMGGLAFASVPLYRAFCQMTGFNGTIGKAATEVKEVETDRIIEVRFDTNTNGVPFKFKVDKPVQRTRVGRTAMMSFTVTNESDRPITGRAVFNVLPEPMGPYFRKLQCFCYENQTLQPGETREFPMVYFLDPELLKNIDTRNLTDITLSYTFYESKGDEK